MNGDFINYAQLRREYNRMASSLTVTRPVSNNAPAVSDRYREECIDCYAMIATAYETAKDDCENQS
jgi:hypothetical protein